MNATNPPIHPDQHLSARPPRSAGSTPSWLLRAAWVKAFAALGLSLLAGPLALAQDRPAPEVTRAKPAAIPSLQVKPEAQVQVQVTDDFTFQSAPELQKASPTLANRNATITMFDLPYFGDDLEAGERFAVDKFRHSESGSQMWGYDIGVWRKNAGADTWSATRSSYDDSDPKNSDFYVYGKPVYAMSDGVVIACWRNAPENPRPFSSALGDSSDEEFVDQDWHHPVWRAKKMPGGGNHLLVRQDDGSFVGYAHAQTGSIPSSLCPHNQSQFTAPEAWTEDDVPVAQQVRIQAGQKLFLTGNSGSSSAPHLHVSREDTSGNPLQFKFRRGLSTPIYEGNKADINAWTSFAGSRIPDGPLLFWPPERLVAERASHGYAAADFQRWFEHMVDSGYALEWLDAYSVGGKAYLNHIWRPAQGSFRAFTLLTPADYQAEFTKAQNEQFYPVMVDSALVNGQVRYSVIFVKNKPGGFLARHNLTYDQHMAVMDEAKESNLNPVNISVVSIAGQRRYTVLWRSENIGAWSVKSQIAEGDYQAMYEEQAAAGRYPSYVNAYMHNGAATYTVVFAQRPGARVDRHGMTSSSYQTAFDDAIGAGFLTRAVSGYDGAQQNHRFIAFWRQ